ncbi:MAG: hypothetical protein ABSB15_04800 [Bryobacteraceae bacterium]
MSIAAVLGAAETFQARPAGDYPHRQTSEKVTIAADQLVTDEQTKAAFGKVNPWRYGILPVLVVIQNDSPNALRVEHIRFVYVLPDRTRVDATPASDVKYINGARQPKGIPGPMGVHLGSSKNPLAEWEVEGRAFAAKMIPPGQSASGFVYFQTPENSAAASVYISGLENAVTGKELYYFEIPLSGN